MASGWYLPQAISDTLPLVVKALRAAGKQGHIANVSKAGGNPNACLSTGIARFAVVSQAQKRYYLVAPS